MRSCKAGHRPHFSSPELTISFKHEADCAGNKSVTEIYTLTAEDLAVMVETDRRERAALSGKPIDTVQPRHPQVILNDLWRGEEANAHETHRGDRGKGKSRCTCGAGCGPRRGCRLPSTHPWSLDQMLEIDRDPTASERTPEDAVIADEEAQTHASDLAVMREAVARLSDRHQMIVDLMIDQEMSQAEIARHLGVSRARVSQLFREVKTAVIDAVRQSRLNSGGSVGSGVKGVANRATPTTTERQGKSND